MKPIILKSEEVKALQADGKVTISRVIKPQPRYGKRVECSVCNKTKAPLGRSIADEAANSYCGFDCEGYLKEPKPDHLFPTESEADFGYGYEPKCPYSPGSRLWVRESIRCLCNSQRDPRWEYGEYLIEYLATKTLVKCPDELIEWWRKNWHNRPSTTIPSIQMPKWVSRFDVEVTAVRVKQVKDWVWNIDLKRIEL